MSRCPLSNYKELFGKVREGAHQYRVLDTAVVDYVCTILLACLATYITGVPLVVTTIACFVLGIIFHMLFAVDTNTMRFFSLTCK